MFHNLTEGLVIDSPITKKQNTLNQINLRLVIPLYWCMCTEFKNTTIEAVIASNFLLNLLILVYCDPTMQYVR